MDNNDEAYFDHCPKELKIIPTPTPQQQKIAEQKRREKAIAKQKALEEADARFQAWVRRFSPVSVPVKNVRSEFVNACNRLTAQFVTCLPSQRYAEIFTIFELLDFKTSELLNSYVSGFRNSEVSAALQKQCQSYIAPFDSLRTTFETNARVEKMIRIVAEASLEILSKKDFDANRRVRFNVNGLVSAVIVLATKAKREGQNLILGLDTSWIPGLDDPGKPPKTDSLKALLREIDDLGGTLRKMGLDNVIIVHEKKEDLAGVLLNKAKEKEVSLTNVVVLASADTARSDSFEPLRTSGEKKERFWPE